MINLNKYFYLYFYCGHYYRCLLLPLCPPPHSPHQPPSLWPSPNCHLCLWVMNVYSLAHPFTFFHPVLPSSRLSHSCQSVPCVHASVSILFVDLFCSLDSAYKQDHIVFVFHCLAYFTSHNTLQVQCLLCVKHCCLQTSYWPPVILWGKKHLKFWR